MLKLIWRWVALATLASSVLAGYVILTVIEDKVDEVIQEQVELVQDGIYQRFKTFDSVLKKNEKGLDKHLNKILPELAKKLRQRKVLETWSPTELAKLAEQYNVTEIYVVNKETKVVATSFVPDLGFELGSISKGLRDFLEGLSSSETDVTVIDRINASSKTGVLNKYAYFSPMDSSYIFEVSVEIKPYLANIHSSEYVSFIFDEMFTDIIGDQMLLSAVDLFIVNDIAVLPFAGDATPVMRKDIPVIPKAGYVRVAGGEKVVYFSRLLLEGMLLDNEAYFLAVRVRFNNQVAHAMAVDLIVTSALVFGISLILILALIHLIVVRNVVQRVTTVNTALKKISEGDYHAVCSVPGVDEISTIANSVNKMKLMLSSRESELQHAHDTLETKVLERTKVLQQEVTRRKEVEEELNVLATTDPLTKLPNRRMIDQYIERAIITAQRSGDLLAVLFLDLDNFKYVNDSLGHSAGDILLKTIALRVSNAVRSSDIAGRFGGDEFVVLLQNLKGDREDVALHVQTIVEQVLDAIRVEIPLGDHVHHCTVSIGVALSDEYSAVELMYKQADTAMYRAKELGKNHFSFYEESMQALADSRLIIEKEMRAALKSEAFTLNYQPQLNSDYKLIGVEALIRWQKDDGSFVPPDSFIPVAEEIGLIIPIGDWVLRECCRQLNRWHKAGVDVPELSINISAKQFHQTGFVGHVHDIVEAHDISPSLISLEITETALLGNQEGVIKGIRELRESGFKISIDDFGTGYSSLNYLKRLSFDQLKIDRSFVQGLGENEDDEAIAKMIISMTHHLGAKVIAEGVETLEQQQYLVENGCNEYQGYYFSKPLSADDFVEYVGSLSNQ
jgi:diguanylate cyclase (GGDEF)-like protein